MTAQAGDPGVEGNARLTGYVAVALLVFLAIEVATLADLRRFLEVHAILGLFLVPPLLVKLGSVGYRFLRYYAHDPRYRAAGPPRMSMRVLGPVLVFLTLVLWVSGIELWLFGYRFGFAWVPIHHGSAYLWIAALAVHVVVYLRRAPALAIADWRDHLRDATARRSLAVASLLFGVALAVAMLSYTSPFAALAGE